MPSYPGKFQYLGEGETRLGEGSCRVSFDRERLTVTPASGAAIACDLADIDRVHTAEWQLALDLYTGKRLILRQFGSAFAQMNTELLTAWRERTIAALLLEDLQELARFEGAYSMDGDLARAAEIRIFETNLAVLPREEKAFQWRLAEIDSWNFDPGSYSFALTGGRQKLRLSKFAKKTEAFRAGFEGAFDQLRQHSVECLRERFLFLDPDRLSALADFMREGRSVCLRKLGDIDRNIPGALIRHSVDDGLRPYFNFLRAQAGEETVMTGFKFLRPEMEEAATEEDPPETSPAEQDPIFFWFFFPIPAANLVAWESTTGSGRATYFFQLPAGVDIEEHVQQLTRGLALINFRREPVYLPDSSLEEQPRFHRYAIAARNIAELRTLRSSFVGRAVHSSLEAWTARVQAILSGAGAVVAPLPD